MSDGLYKVPLTLRRGSQWAIRCEGCGKELRLGPGSRAAMLRLLGTAGRKCDDCRAAPPPLEDDRTAMMLGLVPDKRTPEQRLLDAIDTNGESLKYRYNPESGTSEKLT